MILSENEVRMFLNLAGFKGTALDKAVRICKCESGYNPLAHNTNNEDSRGLMQINLDAHPEFSNYDLFNPQVNAALAYQLYKRRNYTFKDWTCAYILGIEKKSNKTGENEESLYYIALAIIAGIVLYYA